jgi:hypothetical protein
VLVRQFASHERFVEGRRSPDTIWFCDGKAWGDGECFVVSIVRFQGCVDLAMIMTRRAFCQCLYCGSYWYI